MSTATRDKPGDSPPRADDWMRHLFEATDDGVFVHDLSGRIFEANPAACKLLGYTREEMLGLNTRDIDAPEFADGFDVRLRQQIQHGTLRCEGYHRTKDGRSIPVDISTTTIEVGGRQAVLAMMRDISQRKSAEDDLARKGDLLGSILDNMGDAVLVADRDSRLLTYNPAARRMFGLEAREQEQGRLLDLGNLFLADRVTPFPRDRMPLDRAVQGENTDEVEMFVRMPGKRGIWVSTIGRPLRDAQGTLKGGIIVCRDISERKQAAVLQGAQLAVARALAEEPNLSFALRRILQSLCQALGQDVGILWTAANGHHGIGSQEIWQHPQVPCFEFLRRTRQTCLTEGKDLPWAAWENVEPQFLSFSGGGRPLPERYALAYQEGLRSALAFPVETSAGIAGVLEFLARSGDVADLDLQPLMKALGSQVGQILDRQKVETALRDSEALFHSLVECLPQNIFRKDLNGRFTFSNGRYCETVKLPLRELLGKTDFDLFPPHLAAKYVADDRKVIETRKPLEVVEEHCLPDGRRLYVQVVKTPVYDAEGNLVGTQGMFWDVTEKKRAEEILADSERRYRQLTEATLDAIVLLDEAGNVRLFNPAAERMFGWSADEILGRSADLLIPDAYQELHQRGMQRFLDTKQPRMIGRTMEVQGRRKDGKEFPVEIALSVLGLQPSGQAGLEPLQFLAALRDLTERNRMRSVLFQNEKLASIGLLSAGVAHEINNPLAFVANNLVVLERDVRGILDLLDLFTTGKEKLAEADPDLKGRIDAMEDELELDYTRSNLPRVLERTRDGVDRVTRIVHSLRGLARTDAPKPQEASLRDLVDNSLEILRGRYKRSGIEMIQEHDENPRLTCVGTQISQVILNLLVNAYQALEHHRPEGGRIVVRTRRLDQDMLLEVEDNGPGIPMENQGRLFDPFFTTKDVGEGTGLGLAITHNIVTAHGGNIEVHSRPGAGALFRVLLPLVPPRSKS